VTTVPPVDLRGLELAVTRRLEGILAGDHRGLLPGRGREPGDARPYQPGDDVRRIDWNVTARSGRVHVRDTIADRELETTLVADRSASMGYGTAGGKHEAALSALAVFGFLTQRDGNRVGAALLEPDGVRWVPHRSGRGHLVATLGRLAAPPGEAGIDLAAALTSVARSVRRRGLVVVASDFLDPTGWDRPVRVLAARHEVVAVEVVDPRELELAPVGSVRLHDPETGRQRIIDTNDAGVRARFARAAAGQRAEVRARLGSTGAHHLRLDTSADWVGEVVRFAVDTRRSANRAGRA
jgi:uncharacterized protein (DUF58 family)